MLRIGGASAGIGMVLIVLTACVASVIASAAPRAETHDVADKTVPQGEDPPGTDEDQQSPPPAQHKGVIPPPPMGDEGIYTKVPNPEAGHEKEVIPPPGSPGGDPNVEPR
jgi:hypothetical protein